MEPTCSASGGSKSSEVPASLKDMLEAWSNDRKGLLIFLNEQVLREQELYWTRFAGFGALHAGLLAVFTITDVDLRVVVCLVALVLAWLWVRVQNRSLWYAKRSKGPYNDLRRLMCVEYPDAPAEAMSSTELGVIPTYLVTFLWGVLTLFSVRHLLCIWAARCLTST